MGMTEIKKKKQKKNRAELLKLANDCDSPGDLSEKLTWIQWGWGQTWESASKSQIILSGLRLHFEEKGTRRFKTSILQVLLISQSHPAEKSKITNMVWLFRRRGHEI